LNLKSPSSPVALGMVQCPQGILTCARKFGASLPDLDREETEDLLQLGEAAFGPHTHVAVIGMSLCYRVPLTALTYQSAIKVAGA